MGLLKDSLDRADRRVIIDDTVRLIDSEVGSKSGLTGTALKGGYKVVKRLRSGRMIADAVDYLLDDFTTALDPLFEEYHDEGGEGGFDGYLTRHSSRAADALLGITDAKAQRAENKVLLSTYKKLRGQASRHVVDALPGVGRLIDRHVVLE